MGNSKPWKIRIIKYVKQWKDEAKVYIAAIKKYECRRYSWVLTSVIRHLKW